MADPAVQRDPTPLEAALERVGDRWSLLIVEALLDGPRRFNEVGVAVPGIAPNILTDRLRRLERERIVVATPYQQRPPRMSYALTADGHDLASVLRMLADWGARGTPDADPTRHGLCGTPLETRWYCPTCEVAVEDPDADGLARRCTRPRHVEDERWEPGMPVLDRQAGARPGPAAEPPGPAAPLGPRGRADAAPEALHQPSVIVLICGAIAITALELGAGLGSPLVKLCVVIAAPLLVVTTADAVLRIWRSAWAWMPVDRTKGMFRLAWVAVSLIGLAALVAASILVILA